MPPTPSQTSDSSPNAVEDAITTALEYANVRSNIGSVATRQRNSILRDYSNIGVTLLGGVLTVLTVKPDLAKTPSLLYIGSFVIFASVMFAFVIRRSLLNYVQQLLFAESQQYFKVANPARNFRREPNNPVAQDAFLRALSDPPYSA